MLPRLVLPAQDELLQHGIPAARKAEIQIIWLNWGVDEEDLQALPPSAIRMFGWYTECPCVYYGLFQPLSMALNAKEKSRQHAEIPTGRHLGSELRCFILSDTTETDASHGSS